MTLALLLTAVTGAWAQSYEAKVVEFEVPAGWEGDNSNMTAADLPGFKAVTKEEINDAWDAPAGEAKFIYAFNGDNASYVFFVDGLPNDDVTTPFQKNTVFNNSKSGVKFYYTAEPTVPSEPTEWSLTPGSSANTWTFAMPGSDVVLTPIYAPTKVTLAANDNAMGTVEVASESKVEWTADTWKGWNYDTKEYTVGDITMTSSKKAYIRESTEEGDYKNSLSFGVIYSSDESTVTFSTTGDPFSRIEFTMLDDYSESNPNHPHILPLDNWTFEGKSAVWEGEATKSLTLQSCSTNVSKITFFKGAAIPDGVTVNGDGTFTVAKTATVTLKATPAEGYKLKGWSDAPDCTDLVREITIEPGEEDMIITAIFEEMTYTATFTAANANTIEAGKATVTVGGTAATVTEGKLEGVKMGSEVKIKATEGYKFRKVEVKKKEAETLPALSITNPSVGQLIGSDGKNYVSGTLPTGVTPVAKICYVDGDGHGLALALANEGMMDWSTAMTTCAAHTPAFTGGTWKLASKDEWDNMISAAGSYTALRDGFSSVGGTNMQPVYFWSSTEEDSDYARDYNFSSGRWGYGSKGNGERVRACLAF